VVKKYDSYEAGFYDTQIAIAGISELEIGKGFTYPIEDDGELDKFEYLNGQISAIIEYIRQKDN